MSNISSKKAFSVIDLTSFNALCHGETKAGESYSNAILEHSRDLSLKLFEQDPSVLADQVAVVGIPRGGVPTAVSLTKAFNDHSVGQKPKLVNSHIKTDPAQLYNDGLFDDISHIVIVDGVIGTGKTICQHMEQIPSAWQGRITVFANAASEMGIRTIIDYAEQRITQPVSGITGRVFGDNECDWVDCGGKQVYFIGYNQARNIDYKLPDFGDHINFVLS